MIRELRKGKGMTQSELAQKCGVTQAYISMIERSETQNLSIKVLCKLADALDAPLTILIKQYVGGNHENYIA